MTAFPSPKDRFTSLDTLAVCRELRALDRARVDKAFDLVDGGWSLAFRSPGGGRSQLLLVPGRFAALVSPGPSHPDELSPLARELRRLLTGATLRSVAEPAGERYLELGFSRAEEPEGLLLALEMFGKGNLVVARGGRIAAVAETRRWAHRTVRVGVEYLRPPVRPDPWAMNPAALAGVLEQSRTDLASTLAARLALGGPVAEELVARGGWGAETPASARAKEIAPELARVLGVLIDEIGDHPRGYLYRKDGVPVDATPYRSVRWQAVEGVERSERPTFSEVAVEYFPAIVTRPPTPEEAEHAKAREELERLIGRQRSAIEELADAVAEKKADADAVLAHYLEAEAAVARARDGGAGGTSVTVLLGDRSVALAVTQTPRESAQALYEEAKRLAGKLDGARAALAESLERSASPESPSKGAVPAVAARPRKAFWFEKYRWFISSEGTVVIAGRDASSNDLVVRRNLKTGDIYLHADIHGAASVVAKRPPGTEGVGERTLREAAQWAVAFSKAWRAGLASASAFWVDHDQVSKAGASGEFVGRGAWVIHGTKHMMDDLPTELGLGTIDYGGATLWTAAPPEAVRARGTLRVRLRPGPERDRDERERELSRELGVPRSLLQSLLPAGGLTVERP